LTVLAGSDACSFSNKHINIARVQDLRGTRTGDVKLLLTRASSLPPLGLEILLLFEIS